MAKLDEKSVKINNCLKVRFLRCQYQRGISSTNNAKWVALETVFKDEFDHQLQEKFFQPRTYVEKVVYAEKLRGILNTLSGGKEVWESIPKCSSWDDFYSRYLTLVKECYNKECFIKTLPKKHWREPELLTATLADNDFISLKPELEYSVIESSIAEEVFEHVIDYGEKEAEYQEESIF